MGKTRDRVRTIRRVAAGAFITSALIALAVIGYAGGTGLTSSSYYGYCGGGGYGYEYCPPANSAPVYSPPVDQTSNEGASTSFALGSFTDAGDTGPWSVTVGWGDASAPETFSVATSGSLGSRSHTYADNGTYTVTVTVRDGGGLSDSGTFRVVVANVAPTCGPITAPVSPVQVGTLVTASAPFTDPGTLDTHTGVMDWGDTTTSAATIVETNGSGTATATHTYTAAGVYTLVLTITDKDGGSGTCTYQYVVVFETGSFVTGGGWINSPPGAYTANPALTGKATFGFVSKYQKGSTTVIGNTEFQFVAGNLNFKSSSYDPASLVIAGAKAMYSGSGTINGAGDYGFRVSAIDGDVNGGGGVDKFRIKIWNKATSAVVYDNQLGGGDFADPTTAIAGGNIVIHK